MNSGYITEAIVARLRGTHPAAVAQNAGPRLLRDIEASLGVQLQKVADFDEVFGRLASHGPGTHALLLILGRHDVNAHVVVITNQKGVPTIIEGQSWGPAYPAGVLTSAAQAQARYGTAVDLKMGLIPTLAAAR